MEHLLWMMQQSKLTTYICNDEAFKYYEIAINGVILLFRQNIKRPDGQRLYYLNDNLALLLGFGNLFSMMLAFPKIRYWRGFISVQSLRKQMAKGSSFIQDDVKW
jgi:hypothetical protein